MKSIAKSLTGVHSLDFGFCNFFLPKIPEMTNNECIISMLHKQRQGPKEFLIWSPAHVSPSASGGVQEAVINPIDNLGSSILAYLRSQSVERTHLLCLFLLPLVS